MMKKDVKFSMVCKGKKIADYLVNEKKYTIPFSAVIKYWSYATEEDVEWAKMSLLDDGNILFILTTGSDQGGVVCIWDTEEHKLIHISEGSYAIAATVYDGYVYTLCYMHHWGAEETFAITKATVGTMDAWADTQGEAITFNEYNGSDVDFKVDATGRRIIQDERSYSV